VSFPVTRSTTRSMMAVLGAGLLAPVLSAGQPAVAAPSVPTIVPTTVTSTRPVLQVRPVRADRSALRTRSSDVGSFEVPALQAGALAAAALREGAFVKRSDGRIFRIVGGAPLYVSTWSAFGGAQRSSAVTDAQFDALALWPADGTFVRTGQDGRIYRFVGGAPFYVSAWSAFGGRAQPALTVDRTVFDRAGTDADPWFGVNTAPVDYRYTVTGNELEATSLNGALFVRGGQTGRVYKLVGGSPQYVSSWSAFGGAKPAVTVDQAAIDRAGQAAPYRFVGRHPKDQWLLRTQAGQVFVVAGGAPLYVATPAILDQISDGLAPAQVDGADVQHGGGPVPWDHLRWSPRDGTFLAGLPSGQVWQVEAGVATRLNSWDDVGGRQPFTWIDDLAVERAGESGPWAHLSGPA
jgi:hypothetical protein